VTFVTFLDQAKLLEAEEGIAKGRDVDIQKVGYCSAT
jgi:hypothetical protein